MNQPATCQPHPEPPRFRRWQEALYWLADHGWRQAGEMRGSHMRLEHPAYSRPLHLIYPHNGWEQYQQMQLEKSLRKLDRVARRSL